MKEFYCPLCGTKHTIKKPKAEIICNCGKTLEVKVTGKKTEIKISGVTPEDFMEG